MDPIKRVPLACGSWSLIGLHQEAELWYKLLKEKVSYNTLKEGLYARYGPTNYEDFFKDLTKFKQTGIVREYQSQFEILLSHAEKMS